MVEIPHVDTPVLDVTADEAADLLRDPYPIFERRRNETPGVFFGSVMDWTKASGDFRPENLYAAVSFDAVNRVFRDSKVFNSHIYDSTIGLFMGPTILAMEGKTHREHRNLVSAAFKSRSLLRWEPEVVRPVVNALIDEFVDVGEADLVRDFTLEFPTRVISKLLGLPEEDLERIFDKFYRVRVGDKKLAGTGLGLAIARGFLEAMGGSIAAANRTDRSGAIFTLTLPVAA